MHTAGKAVQDDPADNDHTGFADNLKCNICLNVAERPVTVRGARTHARTAAAAGCR